MRGWFSIHEIPPYLVLDIPHICGDGSQKFLPSVFMIAVFPMYTGMFPGFR